jgi:hypothetical protein
MEPTNNAKSSIIPMNLLEIFELFLHVQCPKTADNGLQSYCNVNPRTCGPRPLERKDFLRNTFPPPDMQGKEKRPGQSGPKIEAFPLFRSFARRTPKAPAGAVKFLTDIGLSLDNRLSFFALMNRLARELDSAQRRS